MFHPGDGAKRGELAEVRTPAARRAIGRPRAEAGETVAQAATRWAALRVLGARWAGGRIDLVLPGGRRARIGGPGRADATARVHDERLFVRLLLRGELGAGESFVDGDWSSPDLVGLCRAFLRGTRARGAESMLSRLAQLPAWIRHRLAANTPAGSARNIAAHYDLGNAFYTSFLDPETLAYSCGYWPPVQPGQPTLSLAEAQRAKHERLCRWLGLSERHHLLEIGCGWGGMAMHAASTRGCRVTAITISREQHALASMRVAAAGLADRVRVELRDYRSLTGTYDHLVSIEMLEAVGYEYLPAYFERCAQVLRPGGRFALQSITMPDERFDAYRQRVDWMQTYVFPGSCIPSLAVIDRAATAAGFVRERTEDIGLCYAPTLRAWRERFRPGPADDARFVRTWLLYLAFSEAAFAERTLGDHQLLLRK